MPRRETGRRPAFASVAAERSFRRFGRCRFAARLL